jgi:hypothetical protein
MLTTQNAGKDVEQLELSFNVDRNAQQDRNSARHPGSFKQGYSLTNHHSHWYLHTESKALSKQKYVDVYGCFIHKLPKFGSNKDFLSLKSFKMFLSRYID